MASNTVSFSEFKRRSNLYAPDESIRDHSVFISTQIDRILSEYIGAGEANVCSSTA